MGIHDKSPVRGMIMTICKLKTGQSTAGMVKARARIGTVSPQTVMPIPQTVIEKTESISPYVRKPSLRTGMPNMPVCEL